jgi:hypothetical protein
LGANKRSYLQAGADLNFLASAMMETKWMHPGTYRDGDTFPDGTPKIEDDYNAGACKQNWGMMRVGYGPWRHLKASDYKPYAESLNYHRRLEVTVYKHCMRHFGERMFLAGHRGGSKGLASPHTTDINNFITAWKWTKRHIAANPAFRTNDVRFWAKLPNI